MSNNYFEGISIGTFIGRMVAMYIIYKFVSDMFNKYKNTHMPTAEDVKNYGRKKTKVRQ